MADQEYTRADIDVATGAIRELLQVIQMVEPVVVAHATSHHTMTRFLLSKIRAKEALEQLERYDLEHYQAEGAKIRADPANLRNAWPEKEDQ